VIRVFLLVAGLLATAAVGAAVGFGSVGLMPMTGVPVVGTTPTVWVVPAYPGGGR
jgi:hypothetical protein